MKTVLVIHVVTAISRNLKQKLNITAFDLLRWAPILMYKSLFVVISIFSNVRDVLVVEASQGNGVWGGGFPTQ